uniref:Activin_recp domain-containing protein n=1 Tax=Bursaphelenchus xylophilus TaxID=6326 RepID=A0A1I7SSA2_BURXY
MVSFWTWGHLVLLLIICFFSVESAGLPKRMCYQCHMPYQCSTGFCYGDFCVKSLVGDKYVSKGCENKSVKSVSTEENSGSTDVGCLESEVFGVPNTICYCNDVDFCNQSPQNYSNLFTMASFLLILIPFMYI